MVPLAIFAKKQGKLAKMQLATCPPLVLFEIRYFVSVATGGLASFAAAQVTTGVTVTGGGHTV